MTKHFSGGPVTVKTSETIKYKGILAKHGHYIDYNLTSVSELLPDCSKDTAHWQLWYRVGYPAKSHLVFISCIFFNTLEL